jgi:glycosyltransferase involved in cell wall biosynthesis
VTVGTAESPQLHRRAVRDGATSLSVVVSTYEWPEALDAVLRGLAAQSDIEFDVVVADDGSTASTEATVEHWKAVFGERLVHAWQSDDGFRLARVRNLGAATARGSFLVFIDGDCIPRRHFVHAMRRAAVPGWFLASTRLQLSERLSRSVLRDGTPVERWNAATLVARARGDVVGWRHLTPRDRRRAWRPGLPDFAPHGNSYGFCTGVARQDFEAVNGVDMRFVGWGDQDVDLAVRLRRLGLRCGYAGPRSALLHLWHPSHRTDDRETWWLLQETVESDRIEAVEGIRELACQTIP